MIRSGKPSRRGASRLNAWATSDWAGAAIHPAEPYLANILAREQVDTSPSSPVRSVVATLWPHLVQWGNGNILSVSPSGSFAKGTANSSATDIDLFISLSENTPESLSEIYNKLFRWMHNAGFGPRRQGVSIGITVDGYAVDLVPARRQGPSGTVHSLHKTARNRVWQQTDVSLHILAVALSGRTRAIRVLKLWRDQWGLSFPSILLELVVIRALLGAPGGLAAQIAQALVFVRDHIEKVSIIDPANSNNAISDDLTASEKSALSSAAAFALTLRWQEFVR